MLCNTGQRITSSHITTTDESAKIANKRKTLPRVGWSLFGGFFNLNAGKVGLVPTKFSNLNIGLLQVCQRRKLFTSNVIGSNQSYTHRNQSESTLCFILIYIPNIVDPFSAQYWNKWSCKLYLEGKVQREHFCRNKALRILYS